MRRQLIRYIGGTLLSFGLAISQVAHAARNDEDVPLLVGPPISDIRSPYDDALRCINIVLTPEQRRTTFTVASFVDKASKINYVSDSGTGSFSPVNVEDMVYTSLGLAGVAVTDMSVSQRQMMDWSIQKIIQSNESARLANEKAQQVVAPIINVGFKFPDVSITGAITTFDVNVSSGGFSVRVTGVGASKSKSRILVGMDAHLSEMTGGERLDGSPMEAGKMAGVVRINKQIVGNHIGGGATRFFGDGGGATLIDIDLGSNKREAIQHMERLMIDGLVARLITDYFGIRSCDEHIAYGDRLLVPAEEEDVPSEKRRSED